MGSVWVAEHLGLGVDVAVKLLRPDQEPDEERVERFRREAQQAGRLRSPHIVRIQDFGIEDGVPYIVMELLLGEDLGHRLDRVGRLSPDLALRFLSHAARGLSVAHRAGIVHRDIKPANLFLEHHGGEEVLKIVDFGVAKRTTGDSQLTTGGIVWGSPAYMSPEQARGGAVDARTDVWALAAVFYRMLTGQAPFIGKSEHDVIVKLCTETARSPTELNPDLPEAIDAFFSRALRRDPEQRIPDVSELTAEAMTALGMTAERLSWADGSSPVPGDEGRDTETMPLAPSASDFRRATANQESSHSGQGPAGPGEESQPLSAVTGNTEPRRARSRGWLVSAGVALGLVAAAAVWKTSTKNEPAPEPRKATPAPATSPPGAPEPRRSETPAQESSGPPTARPAPTPGEQTVRRQLTDEDLARPPTSDAKQTARTTDSTKPDSTKPDSIKPVARAPRAKVPAPEIAPPKVGQEQTDPVFGLPLPPDSTGADDAEAPK
jgi:serine/threonine-protein kinase